MNSYTKEKEYAVDDGRCFRSYREAADYLQKRKDINGNFYKVGDLLALHRDSSIRFLRYKTFKDLSYLERPEIVLPEYISYIICNPKYIHLGKGFFSFRSGPYINKLSAPVDYKLFESLNCS